MTNSRVAVELVADVAQGGKVLDREADAVEQGDLPCVAPPGRLPGQHLPQLGHGMGAVELLDLALDPGLRGVFDEDVRAQQDVAVQLGLARANRRRSR